MPKDDDPVTLYSVVLEDRTVRYAQCTIYKLTINDLTTTDQVFDNSFFYKCNITNLIINGDLTNYTSHFFDECTITDIDIMRGANIDANTFNECKIHGLIRCSGAHWELIKSQYISHQDGDDDTTEDGLLDDQLLDYEFNTTPVQLRF